MIELTFYFGDDQFLVARAKLGHIFFEKRFFFSFEPETEVDRPDIGVGREGVHDWGGAGGSAAFVFDAATKAAGVEEGRASLGCFRDCLILDLF
jgi:hypothetical protein